LAYYIMPQHRLACATVVIKVGWGWNERRIAPDSVPPMARRPSNKNGSASRRLHLPQGEDRASPPRPGVISGVDPGSLADRLGLHPGDELVSVNDQQPRDVIDVRFLAAPGPVRFHLRRQGKELRPGGERRCDEPLGIQLAAPTFDGIRLCNNRCPFCSVAQMAPGLRRSLYVKDDDYRYSFLFGNYVTLTNLDRSDWRRIREQRLSPLFVSVHATERDVRRRLLGNPRAPAVLPQLRRLAQAGIEVHAQAVLLPGLNDGIHLDRSIDGLARLFPAVRSLSIVPVGLTRFNRSGLREHTTAEMTRVLEQVAGWQASLRRKLGVAFAYLSDEWYLELGEEVPSMQEYDGLDLTENGVGLVRHYLDNSELRQPWPEGEERATLVTGELFAPVLLRSTAHIPGLRVVAAANRIFGPTINVAGLLAGQDVLDALKGTGAGELVLLPRAMFGGPQGESLDGMRPAEIAAALGARVQMADFPECALR
jgi:putative radical SAM enzyme (TIGR03279 family)